MRFKLEQQENPNAYRCCLCCHVRTGTILLGLWHLAMHMIVLSVFAVMMIHPDVLKPNQTELANDEFGGYLKSYESTDTDSDNDLMMIHRRRWSSEDKYVGLFITLCSLFITTLLIFGSIKGQPGYLMPFFCLQVFDFCLACLSVVCYFSYMPNIKQWIEAQNNLPFKQELLSYDEQWLMLIVFAFFVFVLTLKAYFIGIVWSCYKFLTRRAANDTITRYMDDGSPDTEVLLPPKYEDAIKYPQEYAHEYPPPPYSAN